MNLPRLANFKLNKNMKLDSDSDSDEEMIEFDDRIPPTLKPQSNKKVVNQSGGDLINFYEQDSVKQFIHEYHNPSYNEKTQPLKHPARILVVGSSGAGKTNIVMNIIKKMENTFNRIRVFCKNASEPLYEMLESKLGGESFEIHEGLDELNSYNLNTEFSGQELLIFDDLVLEKHQWQIEQLFIRGRKLSDKKGLTLIYLTQIYFKTPRDIRLQCDTLILKKLGSNRDVKSILADKDLGNLKAPQLLKMYDYCIDGSILNFLFIDLASTQDKMFRNGFSEILNVTNFKL